MMALFNKTALECSKLITERYSTSFTLGIKTLDQKFHMPIYAIYGFVRYADDFILTARSKEDIHRYSQSSTNGSRKED